MKPIRVYGSGPLQGCSETEAKGWRKEAALLLSPFAFVDPAERWEGGSYSHLNGEQKRQLVLRDLEQINQCDAVLACLWKPSFGTPMELVYAHAYRKPTVVVCPSLEVSPWVEYHSDFVATTTAEAADWLKWRLV